MKNILILYKKTDKKAHAILDELQDVFSTIHWNSTNISLEECANLLEYSADILLVLGGDGTILHVAHSNKDTAIPIISINTGTLGFFTTFSYCTWKEKLLKTIEEYNLEYLPVIEAHSNEHTTEAMNEIAITRSGIARNISLHVYVDAELVYAYKGDGVIIATPYGSSAFARSAGGSLIHPRIEAYIITPVLPSNTLLTPVIVPFSSIIRVVATGHEIMLTSDGQRTIPIGKEIHIQKSPHRIPFLSLHSNSYFSHLRKKKIL